MIGRTLIVAISLLALMTGCKKSEPAQKAQAPAPEKGAAAAPESTPNEPSPTATPTPPPVEPPPAGDPLAPQMAPPPGPPTLAPDEVPMDDPACEARKEKIDQEFRRDMLPIFHEEEQAMAVLHAWLRTTSDVLSLEENGRLRSLMDGQAKKVDQCRTDFDEKLYKLLTMVALPAEGGQARYPLFFCEGALGPELQDWCGATLLRLGQWELLDALWTEGETAAQYCGGNVDSQVKDPEAALKSTLGNFATCQATLMSDQCSASGLAETRKDLIRALGYHCKAAQEPPTAGTCDSLPTDEQVPCVVARFRSRLKAGEGCSRINRLGGFAVPHVFCAAPELFKGINCDTFLEAAELPAFSEDHSVSCEMAALARNHETKCSPALEGTPQCLLYGAYLASIPTPEESPEMAKRAKVIEVPRPWAETLLSITGVQLATADPTPEVYGEQSGQRPPRRGPDGPPPSGPGGPGEPPPDSGPRKHEHKLLPDLWGAAREAPTADKGYTEERHPGPKAGAAPGAPPPGAPGPGEEIGPPRDEFDDGTGEPPAEVVPGAGQPPGMPPREQFVKPPEQPGERGKPDERPRPENAVSSLVQTQFATPLTMNGGPLQKAMAAFARATLVLPSSMESHPIAPPCQGVFTESRLVPAPGEQQEVRVTALNVSTSDLACEFRITVQGTTGMVEKRVNKEIGARAIDRINVPFAPIEKASHVVKYACIPVAGKGVEKTPEEPEKAAPAKTQ